MFDFSVFCAAVVRLRIQLLHQKNSKHKSYFHSISPFKFFKTLNRRACENNPFVCSWYITVSLLFSLLIWPFTWFKMRCTFISYNIRKCVFSGWTKTVGIPMSCQFWNKLHRHLHMYLYYIVFLQTINHQFRKKE